MREANESAQLVNVLLLCCHSYNERPISSLLFLQVPCSPPVFYLFESVLPSNTNCMRSNNRTS